MTPTKGLRFNHARVLSAREFDGETLQEYEVTRVAQGQVYCRAVYQHSDRVHLGRPERCELATFAKIALVAA